MTARKRPARRTTKKEDARKEPARRTANEDDVYLVPEEDEIAVLPTSIETQLTLDTIEYRRDEENPDVEPKYYVTFHLELPEHIAQQLFTQHVQEGRVTVEFQPANPELRERGMLVRR